MRTPTFGAQTSEVDRGRDGLPGTELDPPTSDHSSRGLDILRRRSGRRLRCVVRAGGGAPHRTPSGCGTVRRAPPQRGGGRKTLAPHWVSYTCNQHQAARRREDAAEVVAGGERWIRWPSRPTCEPRTTSSSGRSRTSPTSRAISAGGGRGRRRSSPRAATQRPMSTISRPAPSRLFRRWPATDHRDRIRSVCHQRRSRPRCRPSIRRRRGSAPRPRRPDRRAR